MSLTPLTNYKTLSDKRLLEAFNDAMTAVDANFAYTLGQVASPVPSLTGVAKNSVIAVGQDNSNNVLEYVNVNDIVDLQTVFSSYTDQNPKINLTDNLEFSVNSLSAPFSTFSVTSRGSSGAGAINNYMRFTQLSNSGELNETHVVSAFSLTSNSVNVTANTGFVELNKLQVGNYKFPNTAGTTGQLLRLGAANTLEFATVNNEIVEQANNYALNQNKALLLKGKGGSDVSLAIYDLDSGIGASEESLSGNQEVFFKFNNSRLLTMTKPTNPPLGGPNSAYLKVEGPLALPSAASISTQNSHEGSIWYDSLNSSLVLVTAQGRLNIKAQVGSAATTVNTEEAKAFNFNTNASIVLGTGSNTIPALKLGNAGLAASSQELRVVFGTAPALKITNAGIEPPVQANGAAKVIFDSGLGLNNPSNPPYTFSGAAQLGLYRSAANAMGIAVQGTCVTEFTNNGIDLKTKKLFNLAAPTGPLEAANKAYVDSLLPSGSTANSIPIYSTTDNRYVQSEVKYSGGVLEVGSGSNAGGIQFKTTNSGAITLKAPTGSQSLTFFLPSNSLTDGILQVNAQGQMYWGTKNSLISGLLKTDGSNLMTSGIKISGDTSENSLLIGVGDTGIYAAEGLTPKIGLASAKNKLLEIDATAKTLVGTSLLDRGPYIRLVTNNDTTPVYSFTESQNSGLASATNGVAVLVSGEQKLTVTSTGISTHNQKIINLATPTANNDAANKAYVDSSTGLIEISFRITELPVGWMAGYAIRLSLFDKALIFNDSAVIIPYESSLDPATISIPENFNTNAKCQCYVNNSKLIKMPNAQTIRQIARFNSSALIINYPVAIGQIITVQLPG